MTQLCYYRFDGSNACVTTDLALERVELEHRVVELLPGLHAASLKRRGFPRVTVPALEVEGRKVSGTRAICEELHALAPAAGLLPTDQAARERVQALEVRGERLQNAMRRLFYVGAKVDGQGVQALVDGTGYGRLPRPARAVLARALRIAATKAKRATPQRAAKDLEIVATALNEYDAALAAGDMGGEVPNAADLQFAPNVAALGLIDGMTELLDGRPCWAAARRLVPSYPLDARVTMPAALEQRARELLQRD